MRVLLLIMLMLVNVAFVSFAWSDTTFQQEHPPQGKMNYVEAAPSSPFDAAQHKFLPVDQAFHPVVWKANNRVWVGIRIHPGYYLYRQRIHLSAHDTHLTLGAFSLPEGLPKHDRFMGDVEIYQHQLIFSVPIEHSDSEAPLIDLSYQGCAEAGLCYPPQHLTIALHPGSRPSEFSNPTPSATTTSTSPVAQHELPQVSTISGWQLVLLLLAGIGLVFTPCVLPMLPIVAALVVGQNSSICRSLLLACCYVLGMIATYTLAGVLIGLLGAGLNIQARLESPWVVIPFAGLFVILAIFSLELLKLPSLGIGSRASRLEERFRHMGPLGLVIAGGISTLIVSPCLSAPLAGVLTYISTTGNALMGALSLFMLSLGMGIPLILVCVFGSGVLPQKGAWMEKVRHLSALILLGVALWLVRTWIPGSVVLLIAGLLIIAASLCLGALDGKTPYPIRAIGIALIVWGICCISGAAMGHSSVIHPLTEVASRSQAIQQSAVPPPGPDQGPRFTTITTLTQLDSQIEESKQTGRPLLLDLYADWCVSCRQMESSLFPQPSIAALMKHFTLVRFDLTSDSPDARNLLKRYSLFGPPGFLFFENGEELREFRLQGEPTEQQLKMLLTSVIKH